MLRKHASGSKYLPVEKPDNYWALTSNEQSLYYRTPWSTTADTTPQVPGKPVLAWCWRMGTKAGVCVIPEQP
jgi:hypothetical protein